MEGIRIRLGEERHNLKSESHAATQRGKMELFLSRGQNVICDFIGVQSISDSYINECFGNLLHKLTIQDFRRKISFRNITPFIKSRIDDAINEKVQKDHLRDVALDND